MRPGSTALMASTVATVLPPGWRFTESVMERSPLVQLAVLTDSTLSSTVATSESRTGLPLGAIATTKFAKAAALLS